MVKCSFVVRSVVGSSPILLVFFIFRCGVKWLSRRVHAPKILVRIRTPTLGIVVLIVFFLMILVVVF